METLRTHSGIIGNILTIVGWAFTITTILLAYKSLKANHRTLETNQAWNRKHYALQMLVSWNQHTIEHRQAIEAWKPGLINASRKRGKVVFSDEEAAALYTSKSAESASVRLHIVQLLNYLEYVAVAYEENIAEQSVIEDSFKDIMLAYYDALTPYLKHAEEHGRQPWQLFVKTMLSWGAAQFYRSSGGGGIC